jgi:transcriptional regulator with XRE-family HTH domain
MADGGKSLDDIGRRISALRTSMGLNKTAFAEMIGTSQPAVSQYENGVRRPELDVALRIRMRTGVTLDWIYEGDRSGLPLRLASQLPDLSEKQAG